MLPGIRGPEVNAMTDDVRERFATLHELVAAARQRLDQRGWGYLIGGSDSESTVARNRLALDSWAFRPRVLRNVVRIDTGARMFAKPIALPVALAPVGSVETFDPGGLDIAARAAAAAGIPIICSGVSPTAMSDVAEATTGSKVYQAYLYGAHPGLPDMVRRAEDLGFDAFCITVDTAHSSRRERDIVQRFVKPWAKAYAAEPRPSLTWDDIKRYKDLTALPLVLKGVATAEDAALAADHGVDVVYVSNHGGRQLDHGRGALDVLPEVVEGVQGRARVWFDGGVCRGGDVVKAVILGAELVGIGRLYLYGLAAAGQAGIERVIELLAEEVRVALGLLGVSSFAELDRSYLCPAPAPCTPGVLSAFPLLACE
jgi:glycolate oxidase